jgi:hypothetical protein
MQLQLSLISLLAALVFHNELAVDAVAVVDISNGLEAIRVDQDDLDSRPIDRLFKRQTCTDQYSNCNANVVYSGKTYAALFPGGSGCTTVAGTASYLVSYACQCTATCPAFCGNSACSTTTAAPGVTSTTSSTTAASTAGLNTSQTTVQQNLLNYHNTLRRTIPSTGMLQMSWDPAVAALAQAWVNTCPSGHPASTLTQYWNTAKFTPTGQNIAWGYSSWNDVVNAWYGEISNFQFGVGPISSSSSVGHYTQVVWNVSYALGCGYAQCPSGATYACNYGVAGNMSPGQYYPYQPGTACSACPNNCSNGLCTNPCPYTNAWSNCETYWFPNGCAVDPYNASSSCPATCICKPQGLIYRP